MYTLTKKITFEAAHHLESWTHSKCHNVHGHSWELEVTVQGTQLQSNALIDLEELGRIMKITIFNKLDHQLLNDVMTEKDPTCEFIARWAWQELKPALPFLVQVRVQETSTGWATYSGASRDEGHSH